MWLMATRFRIRLRVDLMKVWKPLSHRIRLFLSLAAEGQGSIVVSRPGSSVESKGRGGFEIFLLNMTFTHDQSCECAKTEFDVFSVPTTQTSIEYGNYVEYHSLSSITDSGPIEFDVSSGQNYLYFTNTQRFVKAKIIGDNGDEIIDSDHVGGVNLFLSWKLLSHARD